MSTVLIVDDDEYLRKQVYWALKGSYQIFQAQDRTQMHRIMGKTPIDSVLLDLRLPPEEDSPEEGMKALEEIRRINPEIKVIVMTADKKEETSLRAINNGAYDYFSKPFDLEEMEIVLKRALYIQSLERENRRLRQELEAKYEFANIVGKSKPMRHVFEMIDTVAQTDCTVLLRGESGTGKELVARAIHHKSLRRANPLIVVSCATVPETLLESELFGYEKGAFTDATTGKPGKFELASEGTILLDEIGDMSLAMQAKILRIIQERVFERLGAIRSIKADVRLIAATNKNLEKLMKKGAFREELYYRLNVVSIALPPLREKKEDIPLLVNHFLKRYNQIHHKKIKGISTEALKLLIDYDWPGNVRELENVIERTVVLGKGKIILPDDILLDSSLNHGEEMVSFSLGFSLKEGKKRLIKETLKAVNWNQSKAAKILGIHRHTLRRQIEKFGIREGEH